jgi:uncharacterized membrane protein YtjA (UPF0391 family)
VSAEASGNAEGSWFRELLVVTVWLFRRFIMLSWALTFFVVAIIAAVLGFTSIAGAAAGIAKILFFVFLVLTLVALVSGAMRGRPPV